MLKIKYCIEHGQEVHALISIRDTSPFHMSREGHEMNICYGPFAESEPPVTEWHGVFETEPSDEELAQQEADYPIE